MINYKDITRLDLETSSLCNAECRVCSRRRDGGVKNQTFTETYMTIKQVKEWFPEDFIENLGVITMCGNYGDSMTNPDLIPILKYFRSINPNIRFQMNTNASGRNEAFWRELGEIFSLNNSTLVFSVDGLEDTNWIYRKGTHWDKIMSAMNTYISTGANSRWEFLVFRHNEHQVEEARQLAKDMGVTEFFAKEAMGYSNIINKTPEMKVYGRQGEYQYTIKPPISKIFGTSGNTFDAEREFNKRNIGIFEPWHMLPDSEKVGYISDIKSDLEKSYINIEPTEPRKLFLQSFERTNHIGKINRELTEQEVELGKCDIDCLAIKSSHIFVNSYGLVFPCCWHGALYDDEFGDRDTIAPLVNFIKSFGEDTISLKHKSIKEIIDGEIYTSGYLETFKDRDIRNKRLKSCAIICGVVQTDTKDIISSL
jgi:sulfatase maturation enzyme AslB (radical SAM superfamily)